MFNWTTTTLINELPHFADEMKGKALRIGKHLFEKRWVESIRKAEGHNFELCEAELDLSKIDFGTAKVARLYLYVGLEGSEESIYANDWYRKGMPLSVSFAVDTNKTENAGAKAMAAAIVDTIKRFNVFTKVKKVLDVTAEKDSTVLTIKGTHEHQRLEKIQVLVDAGMGEETAVVNYEMNRTEQLPAAITKIKRGVNGFGTHSQLLKDLRLPTAVHNHWLSVQKDEMPVVGALYTQYIINYYAPSTANPSFTAVGNRSMSETTHVFWVKSDLVGKWEEQLAKIDPEGDGLNSNEATTRHEEAKKYTNKKESLVERVETLESK
jgi:hypothetical protein